MTWKFQVYFGFFVEWYINLCGLFNAKAIPVGVQWWYYLTHTWRGEKFGGLYLSQVYFAIQYINLNNT